MFTATSRFSNIGSLWVCSERESHAITLQCAQCPCLFQPLPRANKRTRFCSDKCRNDFRNGVVSAARAALKNARYAASIRHTSIGRVSHIEYSF
jgi:hypothetical protein